MNLDKVFSIFTALVGVAGVMVFVTAPNSADIIRAFGGAFAESTRAATGRG